MASFKYVEHLALFSQEKKKKKKDFTSFCQPTQPIACANYGNHAQIIMKSKQSTTILTAGKYTIVGVVIDGMDVLDKMEKIKVGRCHSWKLP